MIFYLIIALISILGLAILLSKRVLHSALSLLGILLIVAAIFVIAKAEFLAVSQMIVYVGGILILILFGIIITNQKHSASFSTGRWIVSILLIALVQFLFLKLIWNYDFGTINLEQGSMEILSSLNNAQQLGVDLMTKYLVALEFMALFLLITLIGAVIIGGRKSKLI